MENSRHERAIIVAASYVIGFTSAFIAFGANQTDTTTKNLNIISNHDSNYQTAAVVTAPTRSYEASVRIESDGLVVVTDDKERLLSARKSSPHLASVITSAAQPGLAVKVIEAELSRDSEYVYFCEQLTDDAENCSAYIYSIDEDVLHPVVVAGEDYEPNISSHTSAWSPNGYLNIGGYMSASIETPWILQ